MPPNRQSVALTTLYRKDGHDFSAKQFYPPIEWSFFAQARGFVNTLAGGESFRAPGADCLRDMEILESIFRIIQDLR